MMTSSWKLLFDIVLAAITIIESRKNEERERATAALNALSDAFYATSKYYDSPINDNNKKREAQLDIANKWENAANLVSIFDDDLFNRFNSKSSFWREGEAWTEEQIKSANIGLKAVHDDGRILLISRQNPANN